MLRTNVFNLDFNKFRIGIYNRIKQSANVPKGHNVANFAIIGKTINFLGNIWKKSVAKWLFFYIKIDFWLTSASPKKIFNLGVTVS